MPALGEDKLPAMERPKGALDSALRQARLLRNLVVAESRLLSTLARYLSPKEEIDDEGGGTVVVPDEVAEKHVDDIAVETDKGHKL